MKKYLAILFVLAMVAALFGPQQSTVYAAALPAYESTIQVLNLDNDNAATISIAYYNPDGSLAVLPAPYTNPVVDTVAAGSSNTYLPIHPDVGFKGSAVVSSDREVAIVSNLTVAAVNRALGTYTGVAGGGPVLYFPLVDKRNNVSVFSIQNAGSVDAAYTIDFVPIPGGGYADIADVTGTLHAGAAATYTMADYNGTDPWLGSIKVTASVGEITGVLSNVNTKVPDSPTNGVYVGFSEGSPSVTLPLVMESNNGNRTGTNCQNLGPDTATITMSYSPSAGYATREPDVFTDIPVNGLASKTFLDYGPAKWIGSAIVTVSGGNNIVCVVNQSRPERKNSNIYEGFDPAAATSRVVLPLIMTKNFNAATQTNTFTSINVSSVDGTDISVTCDWKPMAGYADLDNITKSGAPALQFNQQNNFTPDNTKWIGSAVCTEDDGKDIVAVVNQSRENMPTGYQRDVTSAYDGFNY